MIGKKSVVTSGFAVVVDGKKTRYKEGDKVAASIVKSHNLKRKGLVADET